MQGSAVGLFAVLVAFLASSTFVPVQNSDAAQVVQAEIGEATGYYVTVTGEDVVTIGGSEGIRATSTGQLAGAKDTLNIKTNSPNGYRLLIDVNSANLVNSTDSTAFFSAATGTIDAPKALGKDSWGFGVDLDLDDDETVVPPSTQTWAAVPTTATQISSLDEPNLPSGTDVEVYFAVNASTNLSPGTYTGTVNYTVFSEGINEDIVTGTYMQDFTMDTCNKLGENASIRLKDRRDEKTYRVTKMKDGNCWMTQNLALDPGITLKAADSNVSSDWEFSSSYLVTGGSSAYTPQVYTADQDKTTEGATDKYGTYGNYYNFAAATAGQGTQSYTGTATQDICPKGWRLPDNAGTKSYSNLMGVYSLPTSNTTDANAVAKVQQSPLYFPLAGRYYNSMDYQGVTGNYWTHTVGSSSNNVYNLHYNTSNDDFYPQGQNDKANARSVRCVFAGQSTDYMQNFTAAMCEALDESTYASDNRKTLVDSRDGKTYRVAKLADGNCWMVQNLALDGTDAETGQPRTLTSADSNIDTTEVASGEVTFPAGIDITGGTSEFDTPQIYTLDQNKTTTSCQYESCVTSSEPYGNYYNWTAATATQGKRATTSATTIKSSVCPKGWRLPDNGTASGAKSYSNLVAGYTVNVDGTGAQMPTSNGTNAAAVKRIQQAPLHFPLAGRYYSGMGGQGVGGSYWSRTVYSSSDYAYRLFFNTSNSDFYPQDYSNKSIAWSVRCVFGE